MHSTTPGDAGRPVDAPSTTPTPFDDDEVFHLLQTRRRRFALHYLREHEGPVTMRDLAEQVAAWEHDTTPEALRSKQRQRVYIPLYQTHLPKLDEAGLIDYDQSRGTVERGDHLEAILPYLTPETGPQALAEPDATAEPELAPATGSADAAARRAEQDSTLYYGGASLFGTGLVAAAWTGLVALPGVVVAAAVTGLFALVTLRIGLGV